VQCHEMACNPSVFATGSTDVEPASRCERMRLWPRPWSDPGRVGGTGTSRQRAMPQPSDELHTPIAQTRGRVAMQGIRSAAIATAPSRDLIVRVGAQGGDPHASFVTVPIARSSRSRRSHLWRSARPSIGDDRGDAEAVA
jgi:hypothetical protein